MKPEIKERWVAALLSGRYKQGRKVLHSLDGKFCPLGVLCDIYLEERGKKWEPDHSIDNDSTILPYEVRVWADVSFDPVISYKDEFLNISALNDGRRIGFKAIAKLIKEQL